jgi:hypothetical protein
MPHVPAPLPLGLQGETFRVASAAVEGVTRKRLRSSDLDARVHGVRAPAGSLESLAGRCRAFAARLPPGAFFSHSTAARLLGAPLPWRLERIEAVHVSVAAPRRAPHATGVIGHSRYVAPGDVIEGPGGLRVSSPTRMWCEMASDLDLPDLVAVADFLIHRRRRLATAAQLQARLALGDRVTRSRRLVAALELSDDRSESRPESRLRVCCVRAGLPTPAVNHELVDTVTGRGVRLDLAWPQQGFAIEYQGDGHRTAAQWRRDMTRRENLRLAGWTILELNADDLRNVDELVRRIVRGLANEGRLPEMAQSPVRDGAISGK